MEPVHDLMMPSHNGARPRRVLLIVATVLALTGALATQHVSAAPTATAFLNEAREFSASHLSGRFSGITTMTFSDAEEEGDDGELGSSMTSKMRITGEVENDKRVRVVIDHGADGAEETIVIGNSIYTRYADSVASLRNQQFAKESVTAPGVVSDDSAADQFDLSDMLSKASEPVISKQDGDRVTLTMKVDPKKISEDFAQEVTTLRIRFVLADGGRVESMTQTWHGKNMDGTSTIHFTDWDKPVKVAEPTLADVDPTPDFEEERIGGYHDSTLVMPRVIPSGWEMTLADLLTADESEDDCDQVSVDYDDTTSESDDPPFAYTYLAPADCIELDGKAFQAGRYAGTIDTDKDGWSWVQLRIDASSVLEIDTNLPPADIARIFGDLVPLDLVKGPTAAGPSI